MKPKNTKDLDTSKIYICYCDGYATERTKATAGEVISCAC